MLLKIAICDDDPVENQLIYTYLKQFELEHDIDFKINTYTSGYDLLAEYKTFGSFNIVFLDVEMPEINGLEVASKIRQFRDSQVKIIFISNYPQYMQDSFEVRAYNYLAKPLKYESFKKIILKIVNEYETSLITKLIIHNDDSTEFINIKELMCVQATKDNNQHLEFVFENKTLQGKGPFKAWEEELSKYNFVCCHRGVLVNLNYIHYFNSSSITLTNNIQIPISRRKEKELRARFSSNILTTIILD